MMKMVESDFNTNCTNFTLAQLEALNLTRSISAMICTIITLLVMILLLCNKAYKTTLQRLFLYLTIVVLLQLTFISTDIQLQFNFNHQDDVCKSLAFFIVWMAIVTYLFSVVTTFHLLYLVYRQLRIDNSSVYTQRSSKLRLALEAILILLCVVSPLTFLWVPFYHGTYGVAMKSCWIINMKRDCTLVGFRDQITFTFGIFEVASFVIVIAFTGVAILFCGFAYQYRLTRRHHLKTIYQTLILMTFLTISAVIELLGLAQYLYNTLSENHIPYGIQVVYEGAIPVSQMVISLGFIAYFYSFKKFKCNFKMKPSKLCVCCLNRRTIKSVHFRPESTADPATAPVSTRVEALSETYFNVPYTGGFTSITDPLISKEDTGYGSIACT